MDIKEACFRLENIIKCKECQVHGNPCDVNCPVQYDAGRVIDVIDAYKTILEYLRGIL